MKISAKLSVTLFASLALSGALLTFNGDAQALERLSDDVSAMAFEPIAETQLPMTLRLSQTDRIRSRRDVMREVKQRYNAEVLRINLNKQRMVYEVRVLMPNGKVKNITVSARR